MIEWPRVRDRDVESRAGRSGIVSEIQARASAPNSEKSPAYPNRVHLAERPRWEALLSEWDGRVASAREGLTGKSSGAGREESERLVVQMIGARDQLADAVRRLPMEVGHFYEEDHHRADHAVAALERLFRRWDAKPA